jgi:hypothetical protein
VNTVAFSPDGALVAAGLGDPYEATSGSVLVWSVESGELLATLEGHTGGVTALAFSPAAPVLASGSADNTVRLWNLDDYTPLAALSGAADWIRALAFAPDGIGLASGSQDGGLQRWGIAAASATPAPDSTPPVTGGPRLEVSPESFDLGDVKLDTPVEAVFELRNVGGQALLIQGEPLVELVEGCCPPRAIASATTIEPGQQATLTLRFTMHEGMDGRHVFRIHLITNDPVEPTRLLSVSSNWSP